MSPLHLRRLDHATPSALHRFTTCAVATMRCNMLQKNTAWPGSQLIQNAKAQECQNDRSFSGHLPASKHYLHRVGTFPAKLCHVELQSVPSHELSCIVSREQMRDSAAVVQVGASEGRSARAAAGPQSLQKVAAPDGQPAGGTPCCAHREGAESVLVRHPPQQCCTIQG